MRMVDAAALTGMNLEAAASIGRPNRLGDARIDECIEGSIHGDMIDSLRGKLVDDLLSRGRTVAVDEHRQHGKPW